MIEIHQTRYTSWIWGDGIDDYIYVGLDPDFEDLGWGVYQQRRFNRPEAWHKLMVRLWHNWWECTT
jgi:hypothetical protein